MSTYSRCLSAGRKGERDPGEGAGAGIPLTLPHAHLAGGSREGGHDGFGARSWLRFSAAWPPIGRSTARSMVLLP